MTNRKCAQCGLVNFAAAELCRRCGGSLDTTGAGAGEVRQAVLGDGAEDAEESEKAPRSLVKSVGVGFGCAALILLLGYISLLETSAAVTYD